MNLRRVVVLELWADPGTDVPRVGKAWLNGRPARTHKSFVAASIAAVKSWKLDVNPATQKSVCVPIEFTIGKDTKAGKDTSSCKPTYAEGYAPPHASYAAGERDVLVSSSASCPPPA